MLTKTAGGSLPLGLRFQDRLDVAWNNLLADIESWEKGLTKSSLIQHHVAQFSVFGKKAYECLTAAHGKLFPTVSVDEQLSFKAKVIGVLTSEWLLLRAVAMQRLTGSPYAPILPDLDDYAGRFYNRLCAVMPESIKTSLKISTPLIHLGALAELTYVNHRMPALLSIPFGASYNDLVSLLAIAHEVAHAVFEQCPEVLVELKSEITRTMGSPANRQQTILRQMTMEWLEEIIADLAGTALAGPVFAQSGFAFTETPDAPETPVDAKHPLSTVRPHIYKAALDYLAKANSAFGKQYAEETKPFVQALDFRDGLLPNMRFIPAKGLTVVSHAQVKETLVKLLDSVLNCSLETLGKQSLGQVLSECVRRSGETVESVTKADWGKISKEECERFILELPESDALCWLARLFSSSIKCDS